MPVSINKRLLGVKEAMIYLSIGQTLFYELKNAGKLKPVKINSRVLFDVYDLDKFIDSLKGENDL